MAIDYGNCPRAGNDDGDAQGQEAVAGLCGSAGLAAGSQIRASPQAQESALAGK